jgi:hypothetical protein
VNGEAARSDDASNLGQEHRKIFDVLEDVRAKDDVERAVRIRQRSSIVITYGPDTLACVLSMWQVDGFDIVPTFFHATSLPTVTRSDIEYPFSAAQPGQRYVELA